MAYGVEMSQISFSNFNFLRFLSGLGFLPMSMPAPILVVMSCWYFCKFSPSYLGRQMFYLTASFWFFSCFREKRDKRLFLVHFTGHGRLLTRGANLRRGSKACHRNRRSYRKRFSKWTARTCAPLVLVHFQNAGLLVFVRLLLKLLSLI